MKHSVQNRHQTVYTSLSRLLILLCYICYIHVVQKNAVFFVLVERAIGITAKHLF